ncbi:unnamed protein product [Echinostoma caproni]|uniref:DDE-1 domain-containing protein n=1 Tax=Echinostoma caproni TaxID=27848 RepID=A0A183AC74_9TREM|nr:unnamed protein product [Echinostoma caproni]
MGNAPCHNQAAVFSNVKLSVIWSFKWSFRKHLLEYVLSLIEDQRRIMKAEMDVLMAMHLVKKAWVSVDPRVLINAFIKAGFKSTLIQPVIQQPEDKCDLMEDFIHCLLMTVFLKKKSPV